MEERHANEQYFFTPATTARLADFVSDFANPCCICAPSVGVELARRGVRVRILDIDERFATTPGFRHYDLYRPEWLGEEFGIIICDPPFFNVSLSQLFTALRLLGRNRYEQPLLISYLRRRAASIEGTFNRFGLQATGYCPRYQSVQALERNEIEFFGNLSAAQHAKLAAESDAD
jgi:hypothetical protein